LQGQGQRQRQDRGRCCCFVEFKRAQPKQDALLTSPRSEQAQQIHLSRLLHVAPERKKELTHCFSPVISSSSHPPSSSSASEGLVSWSGGWQLQSDEIEPSDAGPDVRLLRRVRRVLSCLVSKQRVSKVCNIVNLKSDLEVLERESSSF